MRIKTKMNNTDKAPEDADSGNPLDPQTDLPTWLKDKNGNQSTDNLIENGIIAKSESDSAFVSDPSNSGWHKEVESIVTESTKPIILDESQGVKQDIINEIDSVNKCILDENTLPEWLDLVIETEEERNTTQLNLTSLIKGEDAIDDSERNLSVTISEMQSSAHKEISSTPSMQNLDLPTDTKPLFINIIEGNLSSLDGEIKDFRLDLIENLLLRAETDKVTALGQELIKEKKSVEELSELLANWLTDNPNSVGIWHLLGDAFMHLNRPSKALKAYTEATQLLSRQM